MTEVTAVAELKAATIALREAERAFVAAKQRVELALKQYAEAVAPAPEATHG